MADLSGAGTITALKVKLDHFGYLFIAKNLAIGYAPLETGVRDSPFAAPLPALWLDCFVHRYC